VAAILDQIRTSHSFGTLGGPQKRRIQCPRQLVIVHHWIMSYWAISDRPECIVTRANNRDMRNGRAWLLGLIAVLIEPAKAPLIKQWQLEETATAPVLAVCQVDEVAKGGLVPAGVLKMAGAH
jgi:hypothetical protein